MSVIVDGEIPVPRSAWYHVIDRLTRMDELLEIIAKQNSTIIELLKKLVEKPTAVATVAEVRIIPDVISFPISDKWSWVPKIFTNQVIPSNTPKYLLYDEAGAGWIYYIRLISNNAKIRWVLNVMSDETIEMNLSIEELYLQQGLEDSEGLRILKYDDVNKIYVMEYAPGVLGFPGTPFRDKNTLYLVNPTPDPITFTVYAWLIRVKQ
ncbi:MAG: hypothetical protein QW209_06440 [Nitrososphaerota archaeon]